VEILVRLMAEELILFAFSNLTKYITIFQYSAECWNIYKLNSIIDKARKHKT